MSLTLKFALFTSLLCILLITGVSYLSFRDAYGELERTIGERLEAVVRSGAFEIDGSLHDTIKTNDDVQTVGFTSIRDHLLRLKSANQLREEVYTFRRVGEKLEFVVMTNEKPFVGDTYTIKREMLPTLNRGQSARTGLYTDTHGDWISAYAPIFDNNGQISGLLEADVRVEEFFGLLHKRTVRLIYWGAGFSVVAVCFSFLLAWTVTRKLNHLTKITEKISLGKMNTPIKVKGRDEVAKLGTSLERMRESLVIAAEMIE